MFEWGTFKSTRSERFKRPFRYHPHGYGWDRVRHSRMLCWWQKTILARRFDAPRHHQKRTENQLANWWWRRVSKRLAKIVFCHQQSILECLTLSQSTRSNTALVWSRFVLSVLLHVCHFDEQWSKRANEKLCIHHVCVCCAENSNTFTDN